MTIEHFWHLIEQSCAADERGENQIACLDNLVKNLSPREMISFEGHCWDLMSIAFRRELWAVATIIEPGCNQASFDSMRAWLILRGRNVFDKIVSDPEKIVDCIPPKTIPWFHSGESLLRIVPANYRTLVGDEMPTVPRKVPYILKGNRWTEPDLPALYPSLWRFYRGG